MRARTLQGRRRPPSTQRTGSSRWECLEALCRRKQTGTQEGMWPQTDTELQLFFRHTVLKLHSLRLHIHATAGGDLQGTAGSHQAGGGDGQGRPGPPGDREDAVHQVGGTNGRPMIVGVLGTWLPDSNPATLWGQRAGVAGRLNASMPSLVVFWDPHTAGCSFGDDSMYGNRHSMLHQPAILERAFCPCSPKDLHPL